MTSPKDFRNALERLKGQRQQIAAQVRTVRLSLRGHKKEEEDIVLARALVQLVGKQTQEQLQYHLSELTKLALASVFDDPYEFEVAFENRRGRTEADFWFLREGQRIDPGGNAGLGAVDIAGLALRFSLWSLRRPRSRASIFVDEPCKHLKGAEPNRKALQVFEEICHRRARQNWPGTQCVMIADERTSREELREVSDRMIEVQRKGKESKVEVLE